MDPKKIKLNDRLCWIFIKQVELDYQDPNIRENFEKWKANKKRLKADKLQV